VPDIPLLDTDAALRDFGKSAGAAADICDQLDRDYLISQLCPIPEEAQLDRDVAKFSPAPEAAPGLEKLIADVWPTDYTLAEWTPNAHAKFADLIKRAPSRRKQINDRLEKRGLYRPGIMDRWNQMLVQFDNATDAALPDDALVANAQRFLEVSA
jgi:hypothetical protein